MAFKEMSDLIGSQIAIPTTSMYGSIGPGYLKVIGIIDNDFVVLGEFIYSIWREELATEKDFVAFGKECESYRIGKRTEMPSWHYYNDKLQIQ